MQIGTLTVQNEQDKNEATKRPNLKRQIMKGFRLPLLTTVGRLISGRNNHSSLQPCLIWMDDSGLLSALEFGVDKGYGRVSGKTNLDSLESK